MSVTFCPIASGSNGNSIYVGTENTHILIDAGLSGKRIESGLSSINVSGNMLDAIFISHEHSDHIQGAGILSRRFDVPLYATQNTWDAMERDGSIGVISQRNKHTIYYEEDCVINDIRLRPFEISHDAAEPAGFCVFLEQYKLAVATDLGYVTDTVLNNIIDCDAALLECNHDVDMLKNGSYPWSLKKRILGERGHLSNAVCGQLITEIMSKRLKHVFLGHMSDENNRPVIAMETVRNILAANHIDPDRDIYLSLAQRGHVGDALLLP